MLRARALSPLRIGAAAALLFLLSCNKNQTEEPPPPGRDFSAYPAIVELQMPPAIYALSDPHAAYDRLTALFAKNILIQGIPAAPKDVKWAAGPAVLIVLGDLIDKGPDSVKVIDLMMALEASAAAAGGRVIVTLGNHEAEFLVDPRNTKALATDGIDQELDAYGISIDAVQNGKDPRGAWLRKLPFAARIGRWFFAHAGDTHDRSIAELEKILQNAVASYDYNHIEVIGEDSILESEGFTASDKMIGARYAQAVSAAHIVFGHDPGALGNRGEIEAAQDGALFRIDCGMSPDIDDSRGAILEIAMQGTQEVASSLDADGKRRELYRSP